MRENPMNMRLANFANSRVCKKCRESGAAQGSEEHDHCNNLLAIVNWLLGGRVGFSELQRLSQWVRFRKGEDPHWDAIGEKMQIEIAMRREKIRRIDRALAHRRIVPEIKWEEIGEDSTEYWENWQEANR